METILFKEKEKESAEECGNEQLEWWKRIVQGGVREKRRSITFFFNRDIVLILQISATEYNNGMISYISEHFIKL